MADELKSGFQFSNPCLQAQAAWKLYTGIVKKKQPHVFNEKSKESLEMKVLWEMCTDSSQASPLCCQCLVQLTVEGHADCGFILRRLLNIVPSAKNLSGPVQAISSLLLLQVQESEAQHSGAYSCPYSLRTKPHPFISVLTSRPDSALLLVEQAGLLLTVSSGRFHTNASHAFKMLEPFLKFVFLDPRSRVDHLLQHTLQMRLLGVASDGFVQSISGECSVASEIISFLFFLLPYLQVDCMTSLSHTTTLVHNLCRWMLIHHKWLHQATIPTFTHAQTLVDHLVTLCREKNRLGQDMVTSLVLLQTLHKDIPEAFSAPGTIASLGVLLLGSPDLYTGYLLQLCLSVVQFQASRPSKHQAIRVSWQLLLLPVLQILASPPPRDFVFTSHSSPAVMKDAALLLGFLEMHIVHGPVDTEQSPGEEISSRISSASGGWQKRMEICVHMMLTFARDDCAAQSWIHALQASLSSASHVPDHVIMMLSALLMTSTHTVVMDILKIIPTVAKSNPSQAPTLLPLLLYKMGKETNARVKLELLHAVPKLATHKLCVGAVLRTLQTLGLSPSLKPLSVRLLCKLWMRQSRVFPHLQRALLASDDSLSPELRRELKLAQAASIRDVCRTRAAQHGADMLSLISKLLNDNARPGAVENDVTALIVSMAIQGLHALCQEEVVDVRTAWNVLASKLSRDRRPQVLVALCELFGSVPSLATYTKDYEEFKEEVLALLWNLSRHEESVVARAAFASLALFDPADFKLVHLPSKIYESLKASILASRKPDDADDEVANSIDCAAPPGRAYIELLQSLPRDVLPDFQKFLASVVQDEISKLPRGVAHTASRGSTPRDKAMLGIPRFLMSQFEKSKSPGLNQGLAAGLLFSYEPPFEVQQGRRARMYLVNCARSYRQLLDTLVHEVPVQPSEWHRNLLMPDAWSAFIGKAYCACVQGREAELEMQVSRGHLNDPEELAAKKRDSWLWVRDQFTEQLQQASRGNPSAQGNSVLALAALAGSVAGHVTAQAEDRSPAGEQRRRSFTEWFGVVVETLMVVLDGNYKPQGSTLSWCQKVSSPTSTASSVLSRACAALALSQLVPVLITVDPDKIQTMTDLLKQRLPGQSKAGSSAVIQVHSALGLGMLLSKLYEEHYSDLAGTQGYLLLSTALDVLEETAFTKDLENTEGACLGVGLALSSLCKEGIVDSRVHVTAMHQKLMGLLEDPQQEPGQAFQGLVFSFACLSVSGFHAGLLSPEVASQCVVRLRGLSLQHPQAQGISLALALLLHGLGVSGHTQIREVASEQATAWLKWLQDEDAPTLQRLSGLNGIMGLLGSERGLFQVDSPLEVHFFTKQTKSSHVTTLQQLLTSSGDVGLGSHVAWLLGHVCAAETSGTSSRTSVPSSYSYLQESSLLRALFDFLVSAGKTGPHLNFSSATVDIALTSLLAGAQASPPPVNWASVLGPLMRTGFGEETCRLCLRFAVSQAQASSSLCSFISSWLGPALFHSLQTSCKRELLESFWKLVSAVPPVKVKEFFAGPLTMALSSDKECAIFESAVRGLLSVLELKEPPASVFSWAFSAVEHAYSTFEPQQLDPSVLNQLCRCLAQLPKDRLERLTHVQGSDTKAVMTRCCLAQQCHVALEWLSPCVDWVLQNDQGAEHLLHVALALGGGSAVKKQNATDRLQWFVELTGQIRNAVHQASGDQVLQTGFALLSAASSAWSQAQVSLELGIAWQTSPKESGASIKCEVGETGLRNVLLLPWLLPVTLPFLLSEEPWTLVTGKILEWFLSIRKLEILQTSRDLRVIIRDSILALKHSDAYKQMAVWTEAGY